MGKSTTYIWNGELNWFKLFGEPRTNYNGDGREWTVDFSPDKDGLADLKKEKLTDRLKDPKDGEVRTSFLHLKQNETNQKTGGVMSPPKVVDEYNKPWDSTVKIGNGTRADVRVNVVDNGPGMKKSIYLQAVRVRDLVEYQGGDLFPEIEGLPERVPLDDLMDELDETDFPE